MKFLISSVVSSSCWMLFFGVVDGWVMPSSHLHHSPSIVASSKSNTALFAQDTDNQNNNDNNKNNVVDISGKRIYQRNFYRLMPGSDVEIQNAIMIEERLRYDPDPEAGRNMADRVGPTTIILRKGTPEFDITEELYRFDVSENNINDFDDTTYATILYLASYPKILKDEVLELGCRTGLGSILGAIAAGYNLPKNNDADKQNDKQEKEEKINDPLAENVLTVPEGAGDKLLPPNLKLLTLSDEKEETLDGTLEHVKQVGFTPEKVAFKVWPWTRKGFNKLRDGKQYQTIIGSDLIYSYPEARELARTAGNALLPSTPPIKTNSGGLGFDIANEEGDEDDESNDNKKDEFVAPCFVHIAPNNREDLHYLRQFLEQGYRMTVNISFLQMNQLSLAYQMLPSGTPEEELDNLEPKPQQEKILRYQAKSATHHPEYNGGETGEYFFPMETGEYESGSVSTYLETETDGSSWKQY